MKERGRQEVSYYPVAKHTGKPYMLIGDGQFRPTFQKKMICKTLVCDIKLIKRYIDLWGSQCTF